MIISSHFLKRLLRNTFHVLIMLVAPALLIGFLFGYSNPAGYGRKLAVGLVDRDNTPLTRMLAESLAGKNRIIDLVDETQIRSALAEGKADYVLVIEPGFTTAILKNREPVIRGYSIRESNTALPVKINLAGFISAARTIAAAAGGDEGLFYRGMGYYASGSFILDKAILAEGEKDVSPVLGGTGLLAMSMLFLATTAAIFLLRDRENRTLYRILAAPVTMLAYMLQAILSFLVVALLQVAGVYLAVHFIFGIYLGPSVLNLFAVMAVYALLCVSFTVALSELARTPRQAGVAASLIIIPMCMLGGLLWPREMMPQILQQIGRFMPPSWAIDAVQKVILGNPLTTAALEIVIMLLYALVFFLLGSWRRIDVAQR